ncbi:adenylyltransferase/cytidyltransferase family protein, partial [bacterium]|nr:adenylyltransferase/cytidyltransferase family protein [bacterium]
MIRALYGGSFDPVHAGHLAVIGRLLADGLADRVLVVPAHRSPLKDEACSASGAERLHMLRLALDDPALDDPALAARRDRVEVDPREVTAGRAVPTVETLDQLAVEHPDGRWRLVIGGDHAGQFDRWRHPDRLLELAEVVVVSRGPLDLAPPLAGRARLITDFAHPAEASELRAMLRAGRRPPRSLLPPVVTDHIVAR